MTDKIIALFGFLNPKHEILLDQLQGVFPAEKLVSFRGNFAAENFKSVHAAIVYTEGINFNESTSILNYIYELNLPLVVITSYSSIDMLNIANSSLEICFQPLDPIEVKNRLDISIKRISKIKNNNLLNRGNLLIDQDKYEVWLQGDKVDLTFKEYELLKYLASNPGRVFSREALLKAVWAHDYFGGTRTVDVHIRRIRSKIDDFKNQFIETQWNVGYKFRKTDEKF